MRTIYQVDRLEMDNQSERSRLLFYSIIGCILILGISIVSVLYIRKINARLIASQHKLEKARQSAENSIRTKSLFLSNMSHEIRVHDENILVRQRFRRRQTVRDHNGHGVDSFLGGNCRNRNMS